MPDLSQIIGSIVLAAIAFVFHVLGNTPVKTRTSKFARLFPRSVKPPRSGLLSLFFSIPIVFFIWGTETTSSHPLVRIAFVLTWISGVIMVWISLIILSSVARKVWTAMSGVVLSVLLIGIYFYLCPTLTIAPSEVSFRASQQLYIFRIANRVDGDTYANAFIFQLVSDDLHSARDLDLEIKQAFLRPLEQQSSDLAQVFADTFAVTGLSGDTQSDPVLVLYIYHLGPHESREISLQFNGFIPTNAPLKVTARMMSYTDKATPINKTENIVTVPIGIREPMTIDRMFHCDLGASGSNKPATCVFNTMKNPGVLPKGCFYLAFVTRNELSPFLPVPSQDCDI
jgi:hypothetical protein